MPTTHISTVITTMLNPCPYCHAAAFTPCTNGTTQLRYTHIERNR